MTVIPKTPEASKTLEASKMMAAMIDPKAPTAVPVYTAAKSPTPCFPVVKPEPVVKMEDSGKDIKAVVDVIAIDDDDADVDKGEDKMATKQEAKQEVKQEAKSECLEAEEVFHSPRQFPVPSSSSASSSQAMPMIQIQKGVYVDPKCGEIALLTLDHRGFCPAWPQCQNSCPDKLFHGCAVIKHTGRPCGNKKHTTPSMCPYFEYHKKMSTDLD